MDQLTARATARGLKAPLPAEAPLRMPVQDLRQFDPTTARPLPFRLRTNVLRVILVVASVALTVWFASQMHRVLAVGDLVLIEALLLGLFVLNIGWICFNSVSSVLGLLAPAPPGPAADVPIAARTAILLPTYNEDPAGVIGMACATLRGLAERAPADRFDLFVLSDTNQPRLWLEEQALVDDARTRFGLEDRLFYRHRSVNRERKVGNVTDWVERWGGAYDFMLVLDADSLMEAETMLALARRLEAAPEAGLIQTVPRLIGARTPLARMQQFAGRVYGPMLARGLAAWFGDAGNYWGHNAIMRTAAFAASAGLPELAGRKPFGGLILSHDFVEAALLRRSGYAVYLADDLGGSFERAPPNLVEMVARDRRWAQGNLQHLALLRVTGLHPLSRLHMAMGAAAYLAAPLWLMFLLAGMSLALYANLVPPNYFPDGWALFPTWPQIDAQRAITLFGLCLLALYLPKLLGIVGFLLDPASRGQRLRAAPDFLAECLLSALTAPILMLTQTRAVYQILVGRDSGWNAQARDADGLSWRTLWLFHRRHVLVGGFLAVGAGVISWSLLAWMSPALVSMLVAVPLGAFLGSSAAGDRMANWQVMGTPEDREPPRIERATITVIDELRRAPPPPADLGALLGDVRALARHMVWLDAPTERRLGGPEPVLAGAWLKVTDGQRLADLDAQQSYAVLASSKIMRILADHDTTARLRAL